MFNAVVKEGYRMLALVSDGDMYHAIVRRPGDFQPFIYCWAYDVHDGSWGQGYYCNYYADACNYLADHIAIR